MHVKLILCGPMRGQTILLAKRHYFVNGELELSGAPTVLEGAINYLGNSYQAYVEGSEEYLTATRRDMLNQGGPAGEAEALSREADILEREADIAVARAVASRRVATDATDKARRLEADEAKAATLEAEEALASAKEKEDGISHIHTDETVTAWAAVPSEAQTSPGRPETSVHTHPGAATSEADVHDRADDDAGRSGQKDSLTEAVLALDHKNDDHWTAQGLPGVFALKRACGFDVTRAMVEEAASGYTRSTE